MHEFLLFSQIPAARHDQVLQILAGVTAAPPVYFSEQHVIYQQIKSTQTNAAKKGQTTRQPQATQLSYYKLVRDCSDESNLGQWKVRKEEQPLAGVKDAISRTFTEHQLDEAELKRFMLDSEWFKRTAQFMLKGCHFVQGHIVIRVSRIYAQTQATPEDPIVMPLPASADLRVLDGSGAYVVEASIHTTDGSDSDLREKAKQELLAFSESVKVAIDFYAPDRLALDTRVRGS